MLHIKSAQYMRMPMPKALPENQSDPLDPGYEIGECKLCQNPTYADDLDEGFCQKCLVSGMVHQCNNCHKKITEDEATSTDDGFVCQGCGQDLYQGRDYTGPRDDYYSGPAEQY